MAQTNLCIPCSCWWLGTAGSCLSGMVNGQQWLGRCRLGTRPWDSPTPPSPSTPHIEKGSQYLSAGHMVLRV